MGSGASKSHNGSQTGPSHQPPPYQAVQSSSSCSGPSVTAAPPAPPAYEVVERLIVGSEYMSKQQEGSGGGRVGVKSSSGGDQGSSSSSSGNGNNSKSYTVTVVSPLDQPTTPAGILGNGDEMITLPTVGTQVGSCMGSLHYSLITYNTPVVLVLGRTGCPAIKLACADYRTEASAVQREILGLVDHIHTARRRVRDQGVQFDGMAWNDAEHLRQSIYSEINVDLQIEKLMKESLLVQERIAKDQLFVVGMMCDYRNTYASRSATGGPSSSGCGGGSTTSSGGVVYMTNVNGETNIGKIRESRLLRNLTEMQKDKFVKRLL
eukprot:Nk52_evm18s2391 gene=Nk52_evmTU18s2391